MTSRDGAIDRARGEIASGRFTEELARRVAIPTESQVDARLPQLVRYCEEEMAPSLTALGFETTILANPVDRRGPAIVGTRIEDPSRPTVLIYGHGDVVRSIASEWSEGRDPYALTPDGDRLYGRGVVDNKGQHTLALSALRAVIEERGRLGFNAKVIVETGEEQGSPGLEKMIADNTDLLAADFFLGFDGPRKSFSRMDINCGCRGGVFFDLEVDLGRLGGLHSGHFGGILPDAGILLTQALATITSPKGRIQIRDWLPEAVPNSVRAACRSIVTDPVPGLPDPDPDWGEPGMTPEEKVLAWTSFIILAFTTGNPDNPVNAVPSTAKARCQIRHTVDVPREKFLPALRRHLDEHGFERVRIDMDIGRNQFPASRTDPDDPWVRFVAASLERSTGATPNVIPGSSGSNPSEMFKARLGLPVMWMPHSYRGCNQHGADEHGLVSLFEEGLGATAGVWWDLGDMRDMPG